MFGGSGYRPTKVKKYYNKRHIYMKNYIIDINIVVDKFIWNRILWHQIKYEILFYSILFLKLYILEVVNNIYLVGMKKVFSK